MNYRVFTEGKPLSKSKPRVYQYGGNDHQKTNGSNGIIDDPRRSRVVLARIKKSRLAGRLFLTHDCLGTLMRRLYIALFSLATFVAPHKP